MDKIIPHAFPNTGAKKSGVVNPIDNSKLLGGGAPLAATTKPDYSNIPVYYQRQLPTCGANAATFMSNVLNGRVGSPRYPWIRMRQIDGLSPTDGSAMTTIGTELPLDGVTDLSLLADDTTLAPQDYANPSVLTPAMNLNAITAGLNKLTVISGPFTIAQLKALIDQHKVIMLLVDCGDGWWTKNGKVDWTSDLFPLTVGNFTDHHFVGAYWSDGINQCYIRNSWSDEWGIKGDGWFDSTYLPHIIEVGIPTPKTLPTATTLSPIVALFKKIFGIK